MAGALTWAAYRGPPQRPADATAPPLDRPPTAAEWSKVKEQARTMTQAIQVAKARAGRIPTRAELEGQDATGSPWLPQGIPDNPLIPGVATTSNSCAEEPPSSASTDWWYCPKTGTFRPGGSQSGKE